MLSWLQGDLRFASSEVLSMMRLHHPHVTELKEVGGTRAAGLSIHTFGLGQG